MLELEYLEYRADIIITEMAAIEEKFDQITHYAEVLEREIHLPEVQKALLEVLESQLSILYAEFSALETQLDELGQLYDAIISYGLAVR